MKKIIASCAGVLLGTLLLNGCNTSATPSHISEDMKSENYVHLSKPLKAQEMQKILKRVGENNGWRITEYKSNAMIAEKIDSPNTEAITITFSKDFFYTTPKDASLESAIKEALSQETE